MATVAKQSAAKRAAQNGPAGWIATVKSWPTRFRTLVDGLRREMRLVTWPNREQVQATTVVVLITVFIFALFFGITDFVLGTAFRRLYGYFTG